MADKSSFPPWAGIAFGILALVAVFYLARSCSFPENNRISYTTFIQQLEKNNIPQVTISGNRVTGIFKSPLEMKEGGSKEPPDAQKSIPSAAYPSPVNLPEQPLPLKNFVTYLPPFGRERLDRLLEEKKVEIITEPERESGGGGWLFLLPLILLFMAGGFLLRRFRMQGSNLFPSVNKSRARLYQRGQRRTLFTDVAGMESPKVELQEIVEFLKNPQKFQRLGGKMPKGILLVGAPGVGKTLLARAVAGEADVPFLSISGSDFMEMFVGVGASRVRSLFQEAKKMAPSIIFIDEIDSIGGHRGLSIGGGRDERQQTLNQLLTEMDGFEPNTNVIVLAATNRPDILDPALLRPGRFDRHVTVDLPSLDDRLEILRIHGRNKPLDSTVDLVKTARGTPGFSGADLENLLNEAAILAARQGKEAVGEEDIQEARDKIIMGLERKNLRVSEEEKKILAYHEGGHAVVAAVVPNADPLYKVSVIPRGHAMGVTQQLPQSEKFVYSQDYILDRLAVMLGGRAAENLVFQTSTTGSEEDLKQAIGLARKMVLDWGMGANLLNLALGGKREQYLEEGPGQKGDYSEKTAERIDDAVKKILDDSYAKASGILREKREGLDRIASLLLKKEEIPGGKVLEILQIKRPIVKPGLHPNQPMNASGQTPPPQTLSLDMPSEP
jgi:cell division protease FtsH